MAEDGASDLAELPTGDADWIQAFCRWMEAERRLSPRTVRNYRQALVALLTYVRHDGRYSGPLEAIPERSLRSYLIDAQRSGVARRTLHLHLSAARSFFRYLIQQGWVSSNPMLGIKAPRFAKPLPKFLTEQEMERFLEGPMKLLGEDQITPRQALLDQMIFEALYAGGLRISELVDWRYAQVDMRSRIIRVKGKGGRVRLVPYGPTLEQLLQAWTRYHREAYQPEDVVLCFLGGKPLTAAWVQKRMKLYLELAELPGDLTPHKIRHSYATHMLNAGADLRLVQELLGHQSLSTTQVYTHLDMRRLKDAHRKAHPHG
ncbi:MAG: tyrosine recombinase XerC [Opitutales bacterium]|nr:tyrosine recombinase XerC [Opitutales bacterium]